VDSSDRSTDQSTNRSFNQGEDYGSGKSAERLSPLATPTATREVLERHGLYTKYALGQNFLVNDDIIKKIIELGDVQPSDHVLEVGPGIGTLTAALLKCAGHVTSIEMDYDLPAVLTDTLDQWEDRFTLLRMNALDVTVNDIEQLDDAPIGEIGTEAMPNKLVSNLPYAVAATVTLDYLQKFDSIDSATIMVQREVAERMMAKPGTKTYGAYTVKLSMYAKPVGHFPVSAGNFFPPPRVESTVIRLDRQIRGGGTQKPQNGIDAFLIRTFGRIPGEEDAVGDVRAVADRLTEIGCDGVQHLFGRREVVLVGGGALPKLHRGFQNREENECDHRKNRERSDQFHHRHAGALRASREAEMVRC